MFLIDSPGPARPRTPRLLLPRGKSRQKRAQETAFPKDLPELRGCLVTLRPSDSRSIVRAVGRCQCVLLRTVLSEVLVASRHSARESGVLGANLKNVPLDRVPLAGSAPLKAGRRSSTSARAAEGELEIQRLRLPRNPAAQPFTPPPRRTPKGRPRERSPEPLVLARFWLLLPRGKSNRRVRGRAAPGVANRTALRAARRAAEQLKSTLP